jgi:asparagine synthase (glutamine-hydrolysing)
MGGIPNPQAVLADLLVQFQPVRLARELTQWALVKRQPWIQLLLQAMVVLLPIEVRRHLNHRIATPRWIENQFARRTKFTRLLHSGHETAFPAINFFGPSQRAAITGLFSMANKLAKYVPPPQCVEEFRYPYLDQDLITFVFSIPASQLLRPGERRSLMRRALLDIVPKEILSRRTKQFGARTPALLLDSRWEELESTVQSSLSSRLGFVDRNRLAEALQDVRCGKEIQIVRLLKAVSLEFWLRDLASRDVVYIPGATKSWPDQESPSRNTFRKRSVNEFFGALS